MKFETKIAKLGITEEVKKILNEAELYNPEKDVTSILELSKLRNMDIYEVVGNYINHEERFDYTCEEETEWDFNMQMKNFMKTFEIENKNELAHLFVLGINEGGYAMAYAITDDIILVIDER